MLCNLFGYYSPQNLAGKGINGKGKINMYGMSLRTMEIKLTTIVENNIKKLLQ